MIYGRVSVVVACSVVVGVIIAVVVTSISAVFQSGISPTHRPIIRRPVVPFVRLQSVTNFENTYSLTMNFLIKIMVTNRIPRKTPLQLMLLSLMQIPR